MPSPEYRRYAAYRAARAEYKLRQLAWGVGIGLAGIILIGLIVSVFKFLTQHL
jgi:hypothetical protein